MAALYRYQLLSFSQGWEIVPLMSLCVFYNDYHNDFLERSNNFGKASAVDFILTVNDDTFVHLNRR